MTEIRQGRVNGDGMEAKEGLGRGNEWRMIKSAELAVSVISKEV